MKGTEILGVKYLWFHGGVHTFGPNHHLDVLVKLDLGVGCVTRHFVVTTG